MRFARRRDPSARPAAKPEGIIIFQTPTRDWRERLKALKAAQEASQGKDENGLPKQERA